MNAKLLALQEEKAICYSILDDVYNPEAPINFTTPKVRDKINYIFGKLNEIERQIVIETDYENLPFWKKLFRKL